MKRFPIVQRWRVQAQPYRRATRAWWNQCTRREQRLLALCAVVLPLALVWLGVLQPAWQALATARIQLPQARSDMARLQAIVQEAKALREGRGARVHASQVWMLVPGSLQRAQLENSVRIARQPQNPNERKWEFEVHEAAVAPLLEWLAGLPRLTLRVQSLSLERAQVDGRAQIGVVSGRIVLLQGEP